MELKNYVFLQTVPDYAARRSHWASQRIVEPADATCASGCVYGRPSIKDGSQVVTSRIATLSAECATTESGSQYRLESMNPDYAELLKQRRLIAPVVDDWSLDYDASEGWMLSGNLNGIPIANVHICNQHGNFLTLKVSENTEMDAFVIWGNPCNEWRNQFIWYNTPLLLVNQELETAFNAKCRPVLF